MKSFNHSGIDVSLSVGSKCFENKLKIKWINAIYPYSKDDSSFSFNKLLIAFSIKDRVVLSIFIGVPELLIKLL